MADGFIQAPPDSTGKKVDASSLDVGLNTVMRQRFIIADNTLSSGYAAVLSSGPAGTEGGLVVRNIPSGVQAVSGTIDKISATVAVSGQVSLGPGTSNIGSINNISATVVVSGTVSLGASTANIGTINNISATVVVSGQVSLGPSTNLIGAVSLGAGTANIGSINNISATVVVAGEIANGSSLSTTNKPVLMGGNTSAGGAGGLMATLLLDTSGRVILGAGANNIGSINNISAAVVLAAGAANIGTINNISAAVVLAAGSNNIGTINNISANVSVLNVAGTSNIGGVSLVAGTSNIGFINNISATVIVAGIVSLGAGTNLIGAVSIAAGTSNIGFINNISATVIVAGIVSLGAGTNLIGAVSLGAGTALIGAVSLGAGTANIGTLNNISATVNVACAKVQISAPATIAGGTLVTPWADRFSRQITQLYHPSLLPTASHGPKCVTLSTSATVALIAAPGAGLSVYVTMISCTNGSATLTRADTYVASATASCISQMYIAASGGGFVMKYDPPVQCLSNTALNARVKPNVSQAIFNVHFYVGPK